jgi:hypothetical protein
MTHGWTEIVAPRERVELHAVRAFSENPSCLSLRAAEDASNYTL